MASFTIGGHACVVHSTRKPSNSLLPPSLLPRVTAMDVIVVHVILGPTTITTIIMRQARQQDPRDAVV